MPVITVNLNQMNDATSEAHIRTHDILIDRPESKGGNDQGAMGGELLLAALGGCFNSNLLAAIKARELDIDDIAIEINGNLEGTPPRYESIEMTVNSAYPDRDALEKLVLMSERSCIVANTLKNAVNLTVTVGEAAAASGS
jgi:putative redox protein